MLAATPNRDSLATVFISSPFNEPRSLHWAIRRKLYDQLHFSGFTPWMWEKEGEVAKARHGSSDASIILDAISRSDFLVAFFENRAGSYLPEAAFGGSPTEPFHATVFEICHARKLGKPVHLYIVGHSYKASLASILSILADPLLLPNHAKILDTEEKLPNAVIAGLLQALRVAAHSKTATPDLDNFDVVRLESDLAFMYSAKTVWQAVNHARQIPLITNPNISSETKRLYAQTLATAAGILANQTAYDDAINSATLSVRYFLELGLWPEMYSQIQALSGILNMAGCSQAAKVNRFGLIPALRSYTHLQPAYFDSAGSILMRSGNWRSAHRYLRKVSAQEPRPYTQSKYAAAIAASRETRDLDEATRILRCEALPAARRSGESLAYTLRHTASLAISLEEFREARILLEEAATESLRLGTLHTLVRIRRLETLVDLLAPL